MQSDFRLEDPALGVLELSEPNGYRVQALDLGFPAARAAVVDRVNAHGTEDSTAFYGARAVALRLLVGDSEWASRRTALERLRAFASPARRPVLYFTDDTAGAAIDRMVRLRGDQLGAPLTDPLDVECQVQWAAPEGIIEAAEESVVSVPVQTGTEEGRTYPRTYPLEYPPMPPAGTVEITNEGTEPAAPVMQLWGPCTDPSLMNLDTGEELTLEGIVLTADQYVEVDIRAATVRLQGRADQNLYTNLTLASALWWLQPGSNRVRYTPASGYDIRTRAVLTWRHAWI